MVTSPLSVLINTLARALVDDEDSVQTYEVCGENTTIIRLRVNSCNLGQVIGKQGRTADALRTILLCASVKLGQRTVLEILDEDERLEDGLRW